MSRDEERSGAREYLGSITQGSAACLSFDRREAIKVAVDVWDMMWGPQLAWTFEHSAAIEEWRAELMGEES